MLWRNFGAGALLVEVAKVEVSVAEGEVDVTIPVRCDQLPDGVGQVLVRLVVGTAARPTGFFAAASAVPAGPPVVVQRWSEALTALAWQALLEVVKGVAANAGHDSDGAALVPVAIVASKDGLAIQAQARQVIDRLT